MKGQNGPVELLSTTEAAALLDLTPEGMRRLSDRGDIHTLRTSTGFRFFRVADVKRLAKQRAGKPRTGRPRTRVR